MTIFQAVVLGIVQGITEFLPISSDGHLVFFQKMLGLHGSMLAFDVLVHFGTLLAIVIFFRGIIAQVARETYSGLIAWKRSKSFQSALGAYPMLETARSILVSFVVTAVTALFIKKTMPDLFDNLTCVAWAWFFTGIALIYAEKIPDGQTEIYQIRWPLAVWIGLAQAVAVLPGVSRSGTTILFMLIMGVRRKAAAEFSFLMAIPVILAAVAFEMLDAPDFSGASSSALVFGTLVSFVVGYLTIRALPKLIESGWFFKLGWYLLAVSFFVFFLLLG